MDSYHSLPKRYRIEDPYHDDGTPTLVIYYVVRKTKLGAWVAPQWAVRYYSAAEEHLDFQVLWGTLTRDQLREKGARFVLDGNGKRFAHETEQWARDSYRIRKSWQIRHANRSIARAQNGLHWLDTGKVLNKEALPFAPFAD